jgi:hypothetical protein
VTVCWYADPQEPGAPGVGDLVWGVDNWVGDCEALAAIVSVPTPGWVWWSVRWAVPRRSGVGPLMRRYVFGLVSHVRRPTPDELAAWTLAQG